MKRRKLGLGTLTAGSVSGLVTALACGPVSNLGTNGTSGMSAAGKGDEGGSAGTTTTGGNPVGGTADPPMRGGSAGQTTAGGSGGHAGQEHAGGETGQAGEGPSAHVTPYPLAPTMPISADCSCADANLVCNAASECVPRCEPGGVCAVWRVDRAVIDMRTFDDTLYFVVAGARDSFGNAIDDETGKETLWKARDPDLPPQKVAALAGRANSILNRFGDKTYLTGYDVRLSVVDDAGALTQHEVPDDVGAKLGVSQEGVFVMRADTSVMKLPLTTDGELGDAFIDLGLPVSADAGVDYLFVTDRLWRSTFSEICSFDLADLEAPGHCMTWRGVAYVLGASDGRAIVRDDHFPGAVYALDVDAQTEKRLSDQIPVVFEELRDGFVTGVFYDVQGVAPSNIGRFSVTQAAEPVMLLSSAVKSALGPARLGDLAVSSDAVFFTQAPDDGVGPGLSRYIFRVPIPE